MLDTFPLHRNEILQVNNEDVYNFDLLKLIFQKYSFLKDPNEVICNFILL